MQNEKDFFYHCKKIVNFQDFQRVFSRIDDALLEYVILDRLRYILIH